MEIGFGLIGIGVIVSFVLAIIAIFTIYPSSKDGNLSPFKQKLHNLFKFKKLYVGTLLKVIYTFNTVATVVIGISITISSIFMGDGFFVTLLVGIFVTILLPIIYRIVFELSILMQLLVENAIEINAKMGNKRGTSKPESQMFSQQTSQPTAEPVEQKTKFCTKCGTKYIVGQGCQNC